MRRWLIPLSSLLLLSACGGSPTPLPVDAGITDTPAPTAEPAPVRYALAPNTRGYVPQLATLQEGAQVQELQIIPDDPAPGPNYDIIVSYGAAPDWTPVEPPLNVTLIIMPLADARLAGVVTISIDPQALADALAMTGVQPLATNAADPVAVRNTLANLGYPDGFGLTIGHAFVPGVEPLAAQLAAAGIDSRIVPLEPDDLRAALVAGDVQVGLFTWANPAQREEWTSTLPDALAQDLYTLPISYRASDAVFVTISPAGWPLAARP
jgi:hypothetical protein